MTVKSTIFWEVTQYSIVTFTDGLEEHNACTFRVEE
jgi:hypothetical protein